MHDGAGRAKLPHVVEETELLLRSAVVNHLLSLRVDLSNWTPSQGDGIQGAEMKTVLCGTGSIIARKLCEKTVAIEDGAKVLQGPTCERSHHHRRVAPKHH